MSPCTHADIGYLLQVDAICVHLCTLFIVPQRSCRIYSNACSYEEGKLANVYSWIKHVIKYEYYIVFLCLVIIFEEVLVCYLFCIFIHSMNLHSY